MTCKPLPYNHKRYLYDKCESLASNYITSHRIPRFGFCGARGSARDARMV